ncbi:acylamino-acid-releasing enzyme-like isoform X2 [Phymastichus coffea]|uniref:acylamino-acid-releasing enzyme-like isoform X2 n=1 Tax=Phymastichus coffea TaxID=108790 RepID=UPI00273C49A0|nr:acylamino-acid-releasing enzyme-like isoform X2 [Phymastichus coffea]
MFGRDNALQKNYSNVGTMSSLQVDKILNIYKQLADRASLKSSTIGTNKKGISIQSIWSQRNLETRKKQKFFKEFFHDSDLNLLSESYPVDVTSEISTTLSNDANLKAILREIVDGVKTKQFIEIWDKQHLIKSYDLSAFDVHGDVYSDSTFSTFQWSCDNTRLLYIAEKKLPKSEPFYKRKSKADSHESDKHETSLKGTEYIFKPDWGEQLVGKHKSVVVILNIENDSIEPISFIPENYFPSQAIWVPNTYEIVGVFYKLDRRYLGKIFCTNRESYIFHLEGKNFRTITLKGLYCSSPRFSPNGKSLVWLERDLTPPHHHVQRLMHLQWGIEIVPSVLVDTVKTHVNISGDKKFYGLYNQNLPVRCWSEDSRYIFLSTPQRFNVTSYVIDKDTKTITEVVNEDDSSLYIFDVKHDFVAFNKTSIIQVSQLLIGKFDSSAPYSGNLHLTSSTEPQYLPESNTLKYECTEYVYDKDESVKDFNFIYFGKKSGTVKSTPLIAVIHGGPHAVYNNEFNLTYAVFVFLGFAVLEINYRGSTGLGGDNVEYIIGRVGESDVLDCVTAIITALGKYPWLDPKKIAVHGGSHGGFISAHLSGQYPNMFRAIVLRNPVIELAAMYSLTDIPDCLSIRCSGETGSRDLGKLPETMCISKYPELMQVLLKHSPFLHVDKVKTPTLIALGSKDLRVPEPQGKMWYYRLCENNVVSKLYIYDDNHSLLKDEVELDFTINAALWFIEHTTN